EDVEQDLDCSGHWGDAEPDGQRPKLEPMQAICGLPNSSLVRKAERDFNSFPRKGGCLHRLDERTGRVQGGAIGKLRNRDALIRNRLRNGPCPAYSTAFRSSMSSMSWKSDWRSLIRWSTTSCSSRAPEPSRQSQNRSITPITGSASSVTPTR